MCVAWLFFERDNHAVDCLWTALWKRGARRPVSRVLSTPGNPGMGRPFLWDAPRGAPHAANPGGGAGTPLRHAPEGAPPATPIRPCSRWGLPCRPRCRGRGALLPHPFTLACRRRSVGGRSALCGTVPEPRAACGDPLPAGRWPAPYSRGARTFLQPGIAPRPAAVQPPGAAPSCAGHRRAVNAGGAANRGRYAAASAAMAARRASVPASATPSTRAGRQWRWKAASSTGSGRSVR